MRSYSKESLILIVGAAIMGLITAKVTGVNAYALLAIVVGVVLAGVNERFNR